MGGCVGGGIWVRACRASALCALGPEPLCSALCVVAGALRRAPVLSISDPGALWVGPATLFLGAFFISGPGTLYNGLWYRIPRH